MEIHPPKLFTRGPAPLARLLFYCALSSACVVLDFHYQRLGWLRSGLNGALNPVQALATSPALAWEQLRLQWQANTELRTQNRQLQARLLEQAPLVQQTLGLRQQLSHLEALLELRQRRFPQGQIVSITALARNPFIQKVILGAGLNRSIMPGSVVMTQTGLVGQITAVGLLSSEATLITNKDLSLPAQVERNGLRVLAVGNGANGTLSLPYTPAGADIHPGDRLVTSGIDGLYPPGILIATVLSVQHDNVSPFERIPCQPGAAVYSQSEVLVLPPGPGSGTEPDSLAADHPVGAGARAISKSHHP